MYTNKEVISIAKSNSRMIYAGQSCGKDSYKLQKWDENRNSWIESCSQYFYQTAKTRLKESYIENVCKIVFGDLYKYDANHVHEYSDWRKYARYIINSARKNGLGIYCDIDLCDIMCN